MTLLRTSRCNGLSRPSRFRKVIHRCGRELGHAGVCQTKLGIWFFRINRTDKREVKGGSDG